MFIMTFGIVFFLGYSSGRKQTNIILVDKIFKGKI